MTPSPGLSAPDRWTYVALTLLTAALAAWTWRAPRTDGTHAVRRLGARALPLLTVSLGLLAASGFDPMDQPIRALRLHGIRPTLEALGTLTGLAALLAALGMPLPRRTQPAWATDAPPPHPAPPRRST